VFLCHEPTRYLIRSPYHGQVLTGELPYNARSRYAAITGTKPSERPPRPTDPDQNLWLHDQIWDMITICWSNEPRRRCELSVMHHVFSAPSCQKLLVQYPPVSRKNLIRLAEELLYTFLILPLDPNELAMLTTVQEYISNTISIGGTPLLSFSLAAAVVPAERFHQVPFPR
jgi:hypothetical protein